MSRSLTITFGILVTAVLVGPLVPTAWGAEARLVTLEDLDEMGGVSFQSGVGDYLLRNDRLEAVILSVEGTPDFGTRFNNGVLHTGGVLIDAGSLGDRNDQFLVMVQNVNVSSASGYLIYLDDPAPEFEVVGSTASITVHGVVVFPSPLDPTTMISSLENPTVTATTTYSLTDGNAWIDLTTTVTNHNDFLVPIFSIGDEGQYFRSQLVFQPFPYRGSVAPPINLANPLSAVGVYPWFALPGVHVSGPEAGVGEVGVCYAIVATALNVPLVGLDAVGTFMVDSIFDFVNFGAIFPGESLTHERRFVVTPGGAVESCADVVMPLLWEPILGVDARATYTGRVVTPPGEPIADATIFFDNVSPGFPEDPALNALVTAVDDNQDGTADAILPAAAGSPVPATHVRTDADGRFTVKLQATVDPASEATVYQGEVWAESRPVLALPPLTVDVATITGGPVDLGDVVMAGTGTAQINVYRQFSFAPAQPVPARIAIYGTDGTDDPDLGDRYVARRRFPGLTQREGDGGDPLTRFNTRLLSGALTGYPAVNFSASHDGAFTLELAPGSYEVWASRGPEYSLDVAAFTVAEGETTQVTLNLRRLVRTPGYVSVDGHVHSAASWDAGSPLADRVVSMLAAGIQTIISTDHDQITDYAPVIADLGMEYEIRSVIGNELSAQRPVPVSTYTEGYDAYPNSIGHLGAWPLSVIMGNRRGGAPQEEGFVTATVIDRLRGMDSLPLLGATPDTATLDQWLAAIQAGVPGTPGEHLPPDEEIVVQNHPRATGLLGPWNWYAFEGYDPTLPVDEYPNFLADLRSRYHKDYQGPDGTDTRGLDFDAVEVLNAATVGWYLTTREDWFSLLDQGIHRAAIACSDTHRVVLDAPGYARFYVACDPNRRHCREQEMVKSVRGMRVVGTLGPFVRFAVLRGSEAPPAPGEPFDGIGSTVKVRSSVVRLFVEVQAAPWIPVEEVRVFMNGDHVKTIPIAPEKVLGGPVRRFRRTIPISGVDADAYFMIEAGNIIDEHGNAVNPELLETMHRVTPPEILSLAFTNPIFVDRDGNGYQPPGL